jgi:hypothetical protein
LVGKWDEIGDVKVKELGVSTEGHAGMNDTLLLKL